MYGRDVVVVDEEEQRRVAYLDERLVVEARLVHVRNDLAVDENRPSATVQQEKCVCVEHANGTLATRDLLVGQLESKFVRLC